MLNRLGDWYPDVDMEAGLQYPNSNFESLAAFFAGLQVLLGEINSSARSANSFALVREHLGFLPERFDFFTWKVDKRHSLHPLRPELHESIYFLSRSVTNSTGWLWSSMTSLLLLEEMTKTDCGYGIVSSVHPFITGVKNPEKHAIMLEDEMPSFFLSETLKYLFLTFDQKNMIHNNKEKDWVFTTEAHPLHHVPPLSSHVTGKRSAGHHALRKEADGILDFLDRRLTTRKQYHKTMASLLSPLSSWHNLEEEKWSIFTKRKTHLFNLEKASKENMMRESKKHELHKVFGRHMSSPTIEGGLDDVVENFASLSHSHRGSGSQLHRSCPNNDHANALWIHALSGGELDYTSDFETIMSDNVVSHRGPFEFHSALTASALYRTSQVFRKEGLRCNKQDPSLKRNSQSSGINQSPLGAQRIDLGGSLGSFDVSVFQQGIGFFVKHINSGESIEVNVFEDNAGSLGMSTGPSIMTVDAHILQQINEQKKNGSFFAEHFFGTGDTQKVAMATLERQALVADLADNAFYCRIELKSTKDGKETTIGTFPCLSATYGPSDFSILIANKGAVVEATVYSPDPVDIYSCQKDSFNSQVKVKDDFETPRIQIVRRGGCLFRDKAVNQMRKHNTKAIIVVNSEISNLFVMANGETDVHNIDLEEEPLSVIVSRDDGDEIIRIIDSHEDSISPQEVIATVRLSPKASRSSTTKSQQWPNVLTRNEQIQVLGSQGWGALANKKNGNWEVLILQHSIQ